MLKTLKRIVQDVTTAVHLADALAVLVQRVRKAIEADAVSVYLIDTKHNEYVLVAADGLNAPPQSACALTESGKVGLVGRREEL